MNVKKWLALALCLILALSALTGCAGSAAKAEPTPEPTAEPTAEPAAAEDPYQTILRQLNEARARIDPDTVICTIDGQEMTWGQMFYFLSGDLLDLVYYLGGLPQDYTTDLGDDMTMGDYFNRSMLSQAKYYAVANSQAADRGVTLSAEAEETIADYWDQVVEKYGGEEAAVTAMEEAFLDRDLLDFFLRSNELLAALKDDMYGADGDKLTEEEILAWAEEQGYIRTKHILYYFYNEDGTPMDEEGKTAQRDRADATLAELRELAGDAQALEARFDEIMNADSGDAGGLSGFPEGYTFTSGTMVPEFETAAFALDDYALSDVVETSYGYHIILRLPMIPEGTTMDQDSGTGAYMTLRQTAANELFNLKLTDWINGARVEWADPAYENMDLNALFDLHPEENGGEE